MSHSKRNTSLAFFTSHERSLLRSSWGSQSTRLTRESFLPFGYCRLCLGFAKGPVACGSHGSGKVHLFCRECVLNDLMAQRKEIKRLERESEMRERDHQEMKIREEEERRMKDVEQFERAEMGFDGSSTPDSVGWARKRKRDAEEMHSRNSDSTTKGVTEQQKKLKSSEASFWIPGSDYMSGSTSSLQDNKSKQKKLQPLCPASTPENKHPYSLKSLITINFSESESDKSGTKSASSSNEPTRICPSCNKALTNTSQPMLGTAEGCGHVICGACADLFIRTAGGAKTSSKATDVNHDKHEKVLVTCYICEADLSGISPLNEANGDDGGPRKDDRKGKHKDSKDKEKRVGRLVEISCEGTGFAGGGTNVAKRDGVAFQC